MSTSLLEPLKADSAKSKVACLVQTFRGMLQNVDVLELSNHLASCLVNASTVFVLKHSGGANHDFKTGSLWGFRPERTLRLEKKLGLKHNEHHIKELEFKNRSFFV
eukprot:677458-Amphidinium_carterae.1